MGMSKGIVRFAGLLVCIAAVALTLGFMTPTAASAAVWALPGTARPGVGITDAVFDTHSKSQAPSILFSTWNGDSGTATILRLDQNGQISRLVEQKGLISDMAVAPSGDILFIAGQSLFKYSPISNSVTPLIQVGDKISTDSVAGVRGVAVAHNGIALALINPYKNDYRFGYRDFVVSFAESASTPDFTIVAGGPGGGHRVHPTSELPDARGLAAVNSSHFFVNTFNGHIIEVETGLPNPKLVKIGPIPDTSAWSLAVDSAGKLFYFHRNGEESERLVELDPTNHRVEFVMGGGTGIPSAFGLPGSAIDLSRPSGGSRGPTVNALASGELLITTSKPGQPVLFRATGPSENELFGLIKDARTAARVGDLAAVKVIYELLQRLQTRPSVPTGNILHAIRVQQRNNGESPTHLGLNRDIAKELTMVINERDRSDLFIQLRASMAVIALRHLIPDIDK